MSNAYPTWESSHRRVGRRGDPGRRIDRDRRDGRTLSPGLEVAGVVHERRRGQRSPGCRTFTVQSALPSELVARIVMVPEPCAVGVPADQQRVARERTLIPAGRVPTAA